MPRDHRRTTTLQDVPAPTSAEGQRPCQRGIWCASRTVSIVDGERITNPAMGPRAFCAHDWDLIGNCATDLPGIYLRLAFETAQPAATETQVHVPFGPSIPVRLDVDAAMRLTATRLAMWAARVRAIAQIRARNPLAPVVDPVSVKDAAGVLAKNLNILLALQTVPGTQNFPLPAGRATRVRGQRGTCRLCGRPISLSAASGYWYAADGITWGTGCEHEPADGTLHLPPEPIPPDLMETWGDAEIVRVGADFIGLEVGHDGAMAGLEILHLHYWDRAVLRETPARPEELLGVECKACSLMALRRAQPAWHSGDPEFYSECENCGDLQTEDEYRLWVGQLAAYHKARLAAQPVLAAPVAC